MVLRACCCRCAETSAAFILFRGQKRFYSIGRARTLVKMDKGETPFLLASLVGNAIISKPLNLGWISSFFP